MNNKSSEMCTTTPQLILYPASILYKSIAGRYRPVSYPVGPITTRYSFIKNTYWVYTATHSRAELKKESETLVSIDRIDDIHNKKKVLCPFD